MRLNLLYNKIVADTITEGFIKSFEEIAVPKLTKMLPDVEEIIIYDDYLSDGFAQGGTFFCPLTLVSGAKLSRAFASWRIDSKRFVDTIPYAYVGKDALNIDVSESAPLTVEEKISARTPFLTDDSIKLTLFAEAPTKTFLSGKYSQAFLDVLRENVTRALEKEFRISKIAESSLELTFSFAPESFMEHVLDKDEDAEVINRIYEGHLKNPNEFWTAYPFPATAISDPYWQNLKNPVSNNWGYYTQTLTLQRCRFWMDDYGYGEDFDEACRRWLQAYTYNFDTIPFGQEIHPITGKPSNCSPWCIGVMNFYRYVVRRLGIVD